MGLRGRTEREGADLGTGGLYMGHLPGYLEEGFPNTKRDQERCRRMWKQLERGARRRGRGGPKPSSGSAPSSRKAWPVSFCSLNLSCLSWKPRAGRTSATPALESFGPSPESKRRLESVEGLVALGRGWSAALTSTWPSCGSPRSGLESDSPGTGS